MLLSLLHAEKISSDHADPYLSKINLMELRQIMSLQKGNILVKLPFRLQVARNRSGSRQMSLFVTSDNLAVLNQWHKIKHRGFGEVHLYHLSEQTR